MNVLILQPVRQPAVPCSRLDYRMVAMIKAKGVEQAREITSKKNWADLSIVTALYLRDCLVRPTCSGDVFITMKKKASSFIVTETGCAPVDCPAILQAEKWVDTPDDWIPTREDGKVRVNFTITIPYAATGTKMFGQVRWRVCLWGQDDFGMNRDYPEEEGRDAWAMYQDVADGITIEGLKANGFDYA